MSRKLVIGVCCLNGLLGAGLLWLILGPGVRGRPAVFPPPGQAAEREALSDGELWARAEEASTARGAQGYLRRLGPDSGTTRRMRSAVESLAAGRADRGDRPFLEGAVAAYGARAGDAEALEPLARAARNPEQWLGLRDLAFRSYVERFARLEGAAPETARALIDALHGEANSLSGTALRADRFLLDRGLADAGREEALIERAAATLRDGAALVSNRLAAADVLEGLDAAPPPEALRDLFLGTDSERLRLRLLGLLARKEAAPEELAWLDGLEPRTPGQERLIQDILER